MNNTQSMAASISERLHEVRAGSLQFFGDWFGRPHDNFHTIVRAGVHNNALRLTFDEGETLDVWEPTGLTIGADAFRIGSATRLRWEWYFYGRERTQENRFFLEYKREGASVVGSTNVNWYQHVFTTDAAAPAVAMT